MQTSKEEKELFPTSDIATLVGAGECGDFIGGFCFALEEAVLLNFREVIPYLRQMSNWQGEALTSTPDYSLWNQEYLARSNQVAFDVKSPILPRKVLPYEIED